MATLGNTQQVKYFQAPFQTSKKKVVEIKKAIHRNHVKEEEELRKKEEEKIKNEQKPTEDAEIEVEPDLPPEQKLALLEAKLDELSEQKHKLFLLLKTILSEDEKKKQKEAEKRRLEEQQQQERMLAAQQIQQQFGRPTNDSPDGGMPLNTPLSPSTPISPSTTPISSLQPRSNQPSNAVSYSTGRKPSSMSQPYQSHAASTPSPPRGSTGRGYPYNSYGYHQTRNDTHLAPTSFLSQNPVHHYSNSNSFQSHHSYQSQYSNNRSTSSSTMQTQQRPPYNNNYSSTPSEYGAMRGGPLPSRGSASRTSYHPYNRNF